MTTKKDYTSEEWNQLLQSPMQAGFYVIYADPSITGMVKEMKHVQSSSGTASAKGSSSAGGRISRRSQGEVREQ